MQKLESSKKSLNPHIKKIDQILLLLLLLLPSRGQNPLSYCTL
jgi:hypothetical protein